LIDVREVGTGLGLVPEAHLVHGEEEQSKSVKEIGEARRQALLGEGFADLPEMRGLGLRRRFRCCCS